MLKTVTLHVAEAGSEGIQIQHCSAALSRKPVVSTVLGGGFNIDINDSHVKPLRMKSTRRQNWMHFWQNPREQHRIHEGAAAGMVTLLYRLVWSESQKTWNVPNSSTDQLCDLG